MSPLKHIQNRTHFDAVCACGAPAELVTTDTSYSCLDCYSRNHTYPNIDKLRETSKGNTRLLFHTAYWDGPHAGLILWNGTKAFFQSESEFVEAGVRIISAAELKSETAGFEKEKLTFELSDLQELVIYRPFLVYQIPQDKVEAMEKDHEAFFKHVGDHTEYDLDGKRGTKLRPYSEHMKYYSTKKNTALELDKYPIIGRFRIE